MTDSTLTRCRILGARTVHLLARPLTGEPQRTVCGVSRIFVEAHTDGPLCRSCLAKQGAPRRERPQPFDLS